MSPSELRIGNYVNTMHNSIRKVVCVFDTGIKVDIGDGAIQQYSDSPLRPDFAKVVAIPLTEQWLVDFGFELIDDEFHKVIDDNWCYLCVDAVDFSISLYDNIENFKKGDYCCLGSDADCKHVHQLQNLYFALTGKELKLKKYDSYEGVTRKGSVFKLPEEHNLYVDGSVLIFQKSEKEPFCRAIVTKIDPSFPCDVHIVSYSSEGFKSLDTEKLTLLMTSLKGKYD